MSISLMSETWKLNITSTQKIVMLALCDWANDPGECYPSITSLINKTSLAERTIQKTISELESGGFLRREFRTGRSTVYWLTPSKGSITPPREMHPREKCTPATGAPTPATGAPTPATGAPPPPHLVHPDTSIETLLKHQGNIKETKPLRKRAKGGDLYPEDFEKFWEAYPKKKSKGEALKAWMKLNPDEQLQQEIISAVFLAKTQDFDWLKDGGQYIPHPATYLNGKRWEDEVTTQAQKSLGDRTSQNQGFSKTNSGNSTASKVINGNFSDKDYGQSVIRLPGFPG